MRDDYDLDRFVVAQDRDDSFRAALIELGNGRKLGHWIWWVFPQLAGLGRSERSQFYGISSLAEARAFLQHPVLGPRLREAIVAMLTHSDRGARTILGSDDVKFRSSMTLFTLAEPQEQLFRNVLETFFDGCLDEVTERLVGANDEPGLHKRHDPNA
jgi:uncharacterized protein (DUF1810 family)